MKTDKEVEAEAFLGSKVEKVLEDLRKGLKEGERAMKGAADMSVNSPERVS